MYDRCLSVVKSCYSFKQVASANKYCEFAHREGLLHCCDIARLKRHVSVTKQNIVNKKVCKIGDKI